MALTRDLRIRVSKLQREIIRNNAEIEGKNISGYCRERILSPNLRVEKLVREIHETVVGKPETSQIGPDRQT